VKLHKAVWRWFSVTPYFLPIYLPFNEEAEHLVACVADTSNLSLSGKSGAKNKIVIASFLQAAQASDGLRFVWLTGKDNKDSHLWSFVPNLGEHTITKVRTALEASGFIKAVIYAWEFDLSDYFTPEMIEAMGVFSSGLKDSASLFDVHKELLNPDMLTSATFIEANRPFVLVSKAEQDDEKRDRKKRREQSPKHKLTTIKATYGPAYSASVREVKGMNAFWSEHPLSLPSGGNTPAQYFASATRIYHNSTMKNGGRWYGGWTFMSGNERKALQIDGEPVIEVDLNASQLTLLSALTSRPMRCGDTWQDAYQVVVDQLSGGSTDKLERDKVKQVIVELIGTGNPNKANPAEDKDSPFHGSGSSIEEFKRIRDLALDMYPALHGLNKKLRSSAELSFHEANIITETMLKLKALGVPSYSMHDGLIVKQSDEDVTVTTLRDVYNGYVTTYQKKNKLDVINIQVALSIEGLNVPKRRLSGCYWT